MNIKKVAMMLTIMLITILSASSFYVLTGEAELNQIITVNSTSGIRVVPYYDYEFVYSNETEDPYIDDSSGKRYYIRYTGAESGRTVVDLEDTNVTDKNGKTVDSGLTIDKDGNVVIMETKITSTYKLFSKRTWGNAKNTEVTRIFVPSSIAIEGDKATRGNLKSDGTYEFDENLGIASNTFEGWNTDTEKDVIYHTGQLTTTANGSNVTSELDRTTKISKDKYSNITTYVYLGSENIVRNSTSDFSTGYSYSGQVKNVFVSNEINNISNMFYHGSGTPINYVLLDTRTEWKGYKSFIALFYNQTSLQLSGNFQIPEGVQVLKNMFNGCTTITSLPAQLSLPNSTTNVEGILYGCTGLTSIPDSFRVTDKVTSTYRMFYGCTSLASIPDNYKISSTVTTMQEMFSGCTKLKGSVLIADGVGTSFNITKAFYNAGTSASNYKECNTPLIVRYPVANATIDNYTTNVYTPQTTSGKVTMLPKTSDSNNNWEKIYEDGAPNYDEGGAYYIRYKGTDTTVYMDTVERTGSKSYKDFGIVFSSGTKNPCILNTKLRSTYKMFSYREGKTNTDITRVFIPSPIAINGDAGLTNGSDSYNNNGIATNTFEGYADSKEAKDVIYHAPQVTQTYRGTNLRGKGYDRTEKIDMNKYPNVIIYLYLGNENITRLDAYRPNGGTAINVKRMGYNGGIKNCFVSYEVKYISALFYKYSAAGYSDGSETLMKYVLFDELGTWIRANWTFQEQSYVEFPPHFTFPSQLKSTELEGMYTSCLGLRGICTVPNSSQISNKIFNNAGTKAEKYPGKETPIVVRVYKDSYADINITPTSIITKECIDETSSQSSTSNTIVNVQEATNKIVIEDCTEEISVKVNEVSSQKLTVEDETDYVSVTVNKNIEENKSEEDETQE